MTDETATQPPTEPILAFREWRTHDDLGLALYPISAPSSYRRAWNRGRNEAECCYVYRFIHGAPHPAPRWDCECGLYARRWPDDPHTDPEIVFGAVEMWGHVIEHHYGYRAQYARVAALVGAPHIATAYRVPSFPTREALFAEYPLPDGVPPARPYDDAFKALIRGGTIAFKTNLAATLKAADDVRRAAAATAAEWDALRQQIATAFAVPPNLLGISVLNAPDLLVGNRYTIDSAGKLVPRDPP